MATCEYTTMFKFVSLLVFITCVHSTVCEKNENPIEISLTNRSQFFEWWAKPPVNPLIKFYFFSVTNVDEFVNDGVKPILKEMGPYVYTQTWKKKNIKFNDNGTVSFNQEKIYKFEESLSAGLDEDDVVIIPNVIMLSAASHHKNAPGFLRRAISSIFDILKIKPFVEATVKQLLWGYESPLLKLGGNLWYEGQNELQEEFGLMYENNGTSTDRITIFTGENDISKLGLMDNLNGNAVASNNCSSLMGDGFTFPPHLTKNSTIHVYEKDWCRSLPLVFEKEVEGRDIPTYRYIPSPKKSCSCHQDTSCSPAGFLNVSLYCRFIAGLPILLSLPHFYLANDSYRTAFEGISPPEPEKHNFFIEVQPTFGTAVRSKVRVQTNLVVSQVKDIKQVETIPDMVFPIMWFEEGFDTLPEEMTNQMKLTLSQRNLTKELLTVPSR